MNIIINWGYKEDFIEINGGKVKIVCIKFVY